MLFILDRINSIATRQIFLPQTSFLCLNITRHASYLMPSPTDREKCHFNGTDVNVNDTWRIHRPNFLEFPHRSQTTIFVHASTRRYRAFFFRVPSRRIIYDPAWPLIRKVSQAVGPLSTKRCRRIRRPLRDAASETSPGTSA